MSKGDLVHLKEMLDAAHRVIRALPRLKRSDLNEDELLALGLAKAVELIGESASYISPETRKKHPHVPWAEMIGMRHRIVHSYNQIDFDILWNTANKNVPVLIDVLEAIIAAEEAKGSDT